MRKGFRFSLSLLCLLIFQWTYAQQLEIYGVVSDEAGLPLPGVNILVKGTTNGVMSDFDGEYTITADLGEILVFSYLGMVTQSRRNVTSAISKVDGADLESIPVNSLGEALKGKVLGLRVYSTNNEPGANPTFRIRGGSSINQSDSPIVVVDGVVREISGINPNDIASIEVLKDAASAAIYGARASNGIILITTKKGSVQKPTITSETSTAEQSPRTAIRSDELAGLPILHAAGC